MNRRRFMAICAGTTAALLAPLGAGAAGLSQWTGFALGADARITIAGLSRAHSERLIGLALQEIDRQEKLFSLYLADSVISRLNRDGELRVAPDEFVRLLRLAGTISRATAGAFDPTVQPLWQLLARQQGRPAPDELAEAKKLVGWSGVRIEGDTISFARAGMALTLNGIAQGYATDCVAALLKAEGAENVLADIGEIVAVGERRPSVPWLIGLAEHGDGAAEEQIELRDMAIATTAPRGMAFDADGSIGHIVDPHGTLRQSAWRRISVIHSSAAIADGLSTGFALMGRQDMEQALAAFDGARVIAA